jgi:putative transposase
MCDEIARAVAEHDASVAAFVLMPEHLHLLVYLPKEGLPHRFCMLWRGRAARRVTALLERSSDCATLNAIAEHARPGRRYRVWKEQVRSLPITTERKLTTIVDYIHSNPVRRGLVQGPAEWELSSCRHYECGGPAALEIVPPMVR